MKVSSKFIVMLIIIVISSQVNVYSTIPSDLHLNVGLPLTSTQVGREEKKSYQVIKSQWRALTAEGISFHDTNCISLS